MQPFLHEPWLEHVVRHHLGQNQTAAHSRLRLNADITRTVLEKELCTMCKDQPLKN
jgi:hypothetical protein